MNASELKYKHESNFPSSLFFSRESMKFSGDTMGNFGVMSGSIRQYDGSIAEAWILYRKKTTRKGFGGSFYFSKLDFSRIHGEVV